MSTRISLLALALTLAPAAARATGGDIGHGAHLIEVGNTADNKTAWQLWDSVEGGDPFSPTEVPEYAVIRLQLQALAVTMPQTAAILTAIFESGAVQWRWVEPEIKELPATGETWLRITNNRTQLALSDSRRQTVQISKKLMAALKPEIRPVVLMHEAVWLAETTQFAFSLVNPQIHTVWDPGTPLNGRLDNPSTRVKCASDFPPDVVVLTSVTSTSDTVRNLTNYFMSPVLTHATAQTTAGVSSFVIANGGTFKPGNRYTVAVTNQNYDTCYPSGWNTLPYLADTLDGIVSRERILVLLGETQAKTPLAVAATVDREKARIKARNAARREGN